MTIIELMERAKMRANLPSDYALAKALGTERQIVSGWRKGKRHPSNTEAVQLATLAGLNEMEVIAEIELLTANTEKKKEFWKCYLQSRGVAATIALTALGFSLIFTPEPTEASILHLQSYAKYETGNSVQQSEGIYIMRSN